MALHDITYALKDGKPVHVSEVERGMACGCTCAACGEPLVARKGKVKAHHFAHKSDGNSCGYGYQSSLHLMAKEAIAEMGYIWLPDLYVNVGNGAGNQMLLEEARSVTVDEVLLERRVGGVVPDVVIKSGDEQFLLEVYVTHAVDSRKRQKMEAAGLSAMELDLHDIDGEIDKEYIQELMLGHTDRKYWACSPEVPEWKERYRDAADVRGITHGEDGDCVYGCPRAYDRKYGEKWAGVTRCANCRFCMGRTDDDVYCFGREGIPFPEDIHSGRVRKNIFPAADESRLKAKWKRLCTPKPAAIRREERPAPVTAAAFSANQHERRPVPLIKSIGRGKSLFQTWKRLYEASCSFPAFLCRLSKEVLQDEGRIALPASYMDFGLDNGTQMMAEDKRICPVEDVSESDGRLIVRADGMEIAVIFQDSNDDGNAQDFLNVLAIELGHRAMFFDLNGLESVLLTDNPMKQWAANAHMEQKKRMVLDAATRLDADASGHVPGCPDPPRSWQGALFGSFSDFISDPDRKYADITTDCPRCGHCVGIHDGSVFCSFDSGI